MPSVWLPYIMLRQDKKIKKIMQLNCIIQGPLKSLLQSNVVQLYNNTVAQLGVTSPCVH